MMWKTRSRTEAAPAHEEWILQCAALTRNMVRRQCWRGREEKIHWHRSNVEPKLAAVQSTCANLPRIGLFAPFLRSGTFERSSDTRPALRKFTV